MSTIGSALYELENRPSEYSHATGSSVQSPFAPLMNSVSWASTYHSMMKKEKIDSETCVFTVDRRAHFLQHVTLKLTLPELHGSKDVQIAWSPLIFHAYIKKIQFAVGEVKLPPIDRTWLDMNLQFFVNNKAQYLRSVGDIPSMTDFSDTIKSKCLTLFIPFSFSRDASVAFPLFKTTDPVTVHVTVERDITKLVRVLEMGTRPVIRALDYEDLESNVYVTENKHARVKTVEAPTARAWYAMVTSDELAYHKKTDASYLIETVVNVDNEFSTQPGRQFERMLKHSSPVKSIFFAAENLMSLSTNMYSNYSNDRLDAYAGDSPIETVTLKYEEGMFKMDRLHVSICDDDIFLNLPCAPDRPGYHVISYGTNYNEIRDVAINVTDLTTEISLAFTSSTSDIATYCCKVRMLSFLKLDFVDGHLVIVQ